MLRNKSVSSVIRRGHLMSTVPIMIIMFGSFGLGFYFGINNKYIPAIPIGIVAGIVLPWLYWSMITPRWKVWSLQNVDNVHEWQRRAIRERLIWPEDNFFNRTEIWSYRLRQDYNAAAKRLSQRERFDPSEVDDSIPAETIIYFSKTKNLIQLSFTSFLTIIFFIIFFQEFKFISLFFIGLFLYNTIREYLKFRNREPQLILSEVGIIVAGDELYTWDRIRKEEVKSTGFSNSPVSLVFEARVLENYEDDELVLEEYYYPVDIEIDSFNKSVKELRNLLKTYRIRYETKQKYHNPSKL